MSGQIEPRAAESRSGLTQTLLLILGWLWVAVPLGWGVWQTLRTSLALFR